MLLQNIGRGAGCFSVFGRVGARLTQGGECSLYISDTIEQTCVRVARLAYQGVGAARSSRCTVQIVLQTRSNSFTHDVVLYSSLLSVTVKAAFYTTNTTAAATALAGRGDGSVGSGPGAPVAAGGLVGGGKCLLLLLL
jgi:hypothetical protein